MLDRVEGVDKNEVAAQLLELQTRLQASYQTSAMMSRLSLVEYVR
jgi:flagellin-like hook-associated protein FlgL